MSCGSIAPFRMMAGDSIDCARGQHGKDVPHRTKFGRVWRDSDLSGNEVLRLLVVSFFRDADSHERMAVLNSIEAVCCTGCGAMRRDPDDTSLCSCGSTKLHKGNRPARVG